MTDSANDQIPEARSRTWKQDPEAVRADILAAAKFEFSAHGLSGTSMQDIADRTLTSKRMIFYYFGDKEGLYRAVLEQAYASIRKREAELNLDGMAPVEALRRLVEFTFDHHHDNPDFIRLVMIENIHEARNMREIKSISSTSTTAIDQLSRICAAGVETGVFRPGLDPLALHWQISAISFFNVSNRATFSNVFGERLFSPQGQAELRDLTVRAILGSVLA